MACEKEQARVVDLQEQLAEAQQDCNEAVHGQCARASSLGRELIRARAALQRCKLSPSPEPPPAPAPAPPGHAQPAVGACAAQQTLVNDLLEQYLDAQEDCNQGFHLQCGRAAILLRELDGARVALQACLNASPPRAPTSNLTIAGIERTQAIQFFFLNGQGSGAGADNSVPLVADKALTLRVYVNRSEIPGLPAPAYITGEVSFAGASSIAAFTPIPARAASAIDRGNVNHTLNFLIPASACHGIVTFTVTVFDAAHPGEPAYTSQPETLTVRFDAVDLPRVHGVLINYTGLGLNLPAPTGIDLIETMGFAGQVFPVSGFNYTGCTVVQFPFDLTLGGRDYCGIGWNLLITLLSNLRELSETDDIYLGLLPAGVPTNEFTGCGGNGVAAAFVGSEVDVAHEMCHAFGRAHAPCGDPSDPDDNYPTYASYPAGSIGEFGFNTQTNRVFDPNTARDLMSYCGPPWVSPYTYLGLRNSILNSAAAGDALAPGRKKVRAEYLHLNFRVFADGRFELLPSFHLEGLTSGPDPRAVTSLWCDLVGSDGQVLETHQCHLHDRHKQGDGHEGIFQERVSWHAAAQAIAIRRHREICHRYEMGEMPPEFTVRATRRTGRGNNLMIIQWEPSIEDYPWSYFIRYSHNDGATWRAVAANLTVSKFVVNCDLLAGGEKCFFQVGASSGIRTRLAKTEAFTLPVKAASAHILLPVPNASFEVGEPVVLRGGGFSPDFGTTPFDNVLWSSRVDGHLGNGYEHVVSSLSCGRHRITLSVPDGLGGEATADVSIDVRAPIKCKPCDEQASCTD
jgi:hypothetical protein